MARYELLERIGVGGMAEIFRGKAVAAGGFEKPVAIKRILPHLSQDQRFVELLISEAQILSELRHRNIVQIYDVGLGDDGQYFLVMEFVDGPDLSDVYDVMEKSGVTMPRDVALHICSEVCEALDYAHRASSQDGRSLGLVHRDVSPSNVLLSRSGEVKLTDFGIAKRVEEATGHGGVRGKFAYISPEQARNAHVDARSDVYSMGILLFELLFGRRLFSSMADFDALAAVREGRVPHPREVDAEIDPVLESVLLKCLALDPAERYQSAGELGAALRSYRYSMHSTIADPVAEIATLVSRHMDLDEDGAIDSLEPEPTVVRINTAAGFTASEIYEFDRSSTAGFDFGGEEDGTGAFFEEEATDAMTIDQLADVISISGRRRAVAQSGFPGKSVRSSGGNGRAARAVIPDYASAPATLDDDVEVSETGEGAFFGSAHRRRRRRDEEAAAADYVAHGAVVADLRARPATPTIRDAFYARAVTADPVETDSLPLGAAATPHQPTHPRRQTALLAVVAALLAVIAFLVAGRLLGGGGSDAGEVVDAGTVPSDATVAGDGAPALEMPPDEVDGKGTEAPKKKTRKRGKKRKRKTKKGTKRTRATSNQ